MNIVIWKDAHGEELAKTFKTEHEMSTWAEANREKDFRAFQAQEMQVLKSVQFKLLPNWIPEHEQTNSRQV